MNTIRGLAATVLLSCMGVAQAGHVPSPCEPGEVGEGTNCMYVTAPGNAYDPATGDRITTFNPGAGTFSVDIYMDFGANAVQGGGFDITYSGAIASSASWAWNDAEFPGACPTPFMGEQSTCGTDNPGVAMEGIQFDDFDGDGYGGTTGTQPGFALVGTLTLNLTGAWGQLTVSIVQPYTDATFPNCFAPGAGSGGTGCVPTDFYSLTTLVPLPAALWLMMGALGVLLGFARRPTAVS